MKIDKLRRVFASALATILIVSLTGQNVYAAEVTDTVADPDNAVITEDVSGGDAMSDNSDMQPQENPAGNEDEQPTVDDEQPTSEDDKEPERDDRSIVRDEREEAENEQPEADVMQETEVSDGNADDTQAADDTQTDNDSEGTDAALVSQEFFYETETDGYLFTFSAKENVVPDGSTVVVKRIENSDNTTEKIEKELEKDILFAKTFDITLYDAEGEVFEPENGVVHISIALSKEAMIEQRNYEGTTTIKMIHLHDDAISDIDLNVEKTDSDIEIPYDTEKDFDIPEESIDPSTRTIKEGTVIESALLAEPHETEYYKEIALDFDTESFSEFAIANVLNYSYPEATSGNETTIDLTSMKADLDADFRNVLQGAFDVAWAVTKTDPSKFYKIIVPAGTYYKSPSDDELLIGSNTTLMMDGVTIKKLGSGGSYVTITTQRLGDTGKGGYDDYANIAIIGGCFDGIESTSGGTYVKLAHITGLTIKNVSFINTYAAHMMSMGACKNVKVEGCLFEGGRRNVNTLEAFQLDVANEDYQEYSSDEVYDNFACENVEVTGCTFRNLRRGFGSHAAIVGAFYQKNVYVHDCVFDDVSNAAIMATMWKDSVISGNIMTNVGRGVDTTIYTSYTRYPEEEKDKNPDALSYYSNVTITGNNITVGGRDRYSSNFAGVLLGGYCSEARSDLRPSGVYQAKGYTVSGNTINGYQDWEYVDPEAVYGDIATSYAVENNITGNTFNKGRFGILIQVSSGASNINSNNFAGVKDASIAVQRSSSVSYMEANTLTMDCPFGIYVDDSSSCNGTCLLSSVVKLGVGEKVISIPKSFTVFTSDLANKVTPEYKSSKKSVAKVTKAGKVKGVKKGKAVITASWAKDSGTVDVNFTADVKKAPKKVTLKKKKTLKKGKTYQLKPKVNKGAYTTKFTYKSSNKKIAKVSSTGVVTAKRKGIVTITAKAHNGVSATITIKVK